MTDDTGFGRTVVNIVILGFGLGTTFSIYTLAVQNSVPFSVMGVATSATQFFRSLGGLLGLAVMGRSWRGVQLPIVRIGARLRGAGDWC